MFSKMKIFDVDEILYEITLKCNKNCSYCGSKSLINSFEECSPEQKKLIAKEIVSIKPNSVTITGGEPSVVIDDLIDVAKIIHNSGIKLKILTNGNLFLSDKFEELDNYVSGYGVSINEVNDVESFRNNYSKIPFSKTVMVTNFGSHNLLLFDELWKIAVNFAVWQVQLTMGNDFQLDIDDIEKLWDKIDELESNSTIKNSFKIIKADNFVKGKCFAGQRCFSITCDGNVVPCLSYRSWKNDMCVQGNVFDKSLKSIWKEKFKFYRNRKFIPCCKCITGIDKVKKSVIDDSNHFNIKPDPPKNNNKRDIVFVYGVVTPPNYKDMNTPVVYGVSDFPSIT